MPILCDPANIAYFSVPKCACTSLKMYFHKLENGISWKQSRADGETQRLHEKYPSVPFGELDQPALAPYEKAAVVRAPVARIKSCYTNKILNDEIMLRMPFKLAARAMGLPLKPDLDTFVARLDGYRRACGPIRRHTQPLAFWLGTDASYFDHLFDISDLDSFQALVGARSGADDTSISHSNRTKADKATVDVSDTTAALITDRFAQDIDLFGDVFGGT